MAINVGSLSVDKLYIGAAEIEKIYIGSTLIYENYDYSVSDDELTVNNAPYTFNDGILYLA